MPLQDYRKDSFHTKKVWKIWARQSVFKSCFSFFNTAPWEMHVKPAKSRAPKNKENNTGHSCYLLRWSNVCYQLFSFFLPLFNHCLQFPTFSSATWATNQVPGSWMAAWLEGCEPSGPWALNVSVCRTPVISRSVWWTQALFCILWLALYEWR